MTVTDNNRSRGGSPISICQNGTQNFDAIVWAEREQNKWMVGSDYFRRTRSPNTPVPTSSVNQKQCVVFTQEYTLIPGYHHNFIRIKLYIDGKKVDDYYAHQFVIYSANSWNFLFGPRHLSSDRRHRYGHLIGIIHGAGLINKALNEDEVKVLSSSLDNIKSSMKTPIYDPYYHQIRVDYWLSLLKKNCRSDRVCFYDKYKQLGDFVHDFKGQGISFQFKSVSVNGRTWSAYDVANNWTNRNPYVLKGLSTVPMKYVKAWT